MRAMPFAALLLAGCAQLPPTPEDIQAKRFDTIPDKAVIYIVRAPLDSSEASELFLHDTQQISMHPRTFYRWEVAPGTYRISGMGAGAATTTVAAAPGRLYFLKHTVIGDPADGGVQFAALQAIPERTGRDLVSGATLLR